MGQSNGPVGKRRRWVFLRTLSNTLGKHGLYKLRKTLGLLTFGELNPMDRASPKTFIRKPR
jgi:hypothetical protein